MATNYYATATWAATETDYLNRIVTALTAVGWTLYDSVGAGVPGFNWKRVYRSPDVNGNTGVFFFLIIQDAGATFSIAASYDWDPSTHTGISVGAGGSFQCAGGTGYIYANALGVFICVIDGLYNACGWAGQPRCRQVKNYSDGLCLSTGTIAAGATTVNVNANMTGHMYVGQVVAIQNFAHNSASANKDHRELVTLTAVGASSISFTATSNAYDSGAKIGSPDMLWPQAFAAATWQGYNGTYMLWSSQVAGMNQAGSSTNTYCGPSYMSSGALTTQLALLNASGFPAESFVGLVGEPGVSNGSSALPVPGCLFIYPNFSGGVPADGTKFTDGTNVYVLPKGGTSPGGGLPVILIGPTGDAVNFGTQRRILPPMIAVSDSIYSYPAALASATPPPSAFNQGLN